MSENEQEKKGGQQFVIQRVYVKDISFETPKSPVIFTEKWEPNVGIELNTDVNTVAEHIYEVVISLTVTAKIQDEVAYLAEVKQAGIFTVIGFNEAEMGQMLHSFCPNILFPYAREMVSDLVNRGSFPQLVLAPINFDALYAQHLQKQDSATAH
jgi:preprotein translocase subunit SecB